MPSKSACTCYKARHPATGSTHRPPTAARAPASWACWSRHRGALRSAPAPQSHAAARRPSPPAGADRGCKRALGRGRGRAPTRHAAPGGDSNPGAHPRPPRTGPRFLPPLTCQRSPPGRPPPGTPCLALGPPEEARRAWGAGPGPRGEVREPSGAWPG